METPLIKGGWGVGPSKNWVTWGRDTKILLESGDNHEKGGCPFLLLYSSIAFTMGVRVCLSKGSDNRKKHFCFG